MAKNKVEITGINTKELKTLSNDEMNGLFLEYKNGNTKVKDTLVSCNLKLVLSILKKYQNKCDNMDDLFQIGCVGLIKAINNFDLSYEVKFSTYAVLMIEGEIKRYIRDNNQVKISRSIKETAYDIISYKEEYMRLHSVYPTNKLICQRLGITEYELSSALLSLQDPVSIFEPIYNDGGDTIYLLDQIEDKKSIYDIETILALNESLDKLKEKEKDVLLKRYILGSSQSEIANDMNISQAQVSRIESSALKTIKKSIM